MFESGISTAQIGKYFNIADSAISSKLKQLGYDTTNPKRIPKFNEHIFDCIDTEEKAY